ncbi:MAG TPA: hypothetical protein VLW49_00765 [Gaiellaceae bacterium]|nr:hypothetical protein [Gaiellaceae bacterium]
MTADEVRSTPPHDDPRIAYTQARTTYLDQFERGVLAGRDAWPYVDV